MQADEERRQVERDHQQALAEAEARAREDAMEHCEFTLRREIRAQMESEMSGLRETQSLQVSQNLRAEIEAEIKEKVRNDLKAEMRTKMRD